MRKILSLIAAIGLFAGPAFAQGGALDMFGATRTVTLNPANIITNLGTGVLQAYYTNIVDTHGFAGIAKIDLSVVSNYQNNATMAVTVVAMTNFFYGSTDKTNWSALANTAIATAPTLLYYTNSYYGGSNLFATNYTMLPGTITVPTASTAGWATPYMVPLPFTNATTAIVSSAGGTWTIGYNIDDAPRYLAMVTSFAGSNAQYGVSAVLTARPTLWNR